MPLSTEVKKLDYGSYAPALNHFFIICPEQSPLYVISCREVFHRRIEKYNHWDWFAYTCPVPGNISGRPKGFITDVVDMIDKVEETLNLPERTMVYPSTHNTLFSFYPCSFWKDQNQRKVRYTFLSCMIRAAFNYDKNTDDWRRTLKSFHYLSPFLVDHFLEGNVNYTENMDAYTGIHNVFKPKSEVEIRRLLVKG